MKSMVFKGLVLVSALALVNCDDTAVAPAANTGTEIANPGEGVPGGGDVVIPGTENGGQGGEAVGQGGEVTPGGEIGGGEVPPTSSATVDPTSSAVVNPESSAAVPPASSSAVTPASSSSAVTPASSSSETVVSSSSEEVKPAGIFLAEGTDENKDQMEISYTENIEPCIWDKDKNRNLCRILAYPKRLSSDKKHAVVMWGPGGGSDPKEYGGIIKRLASHGFVVVAIPQSPGDASQGKPAIDWLESKNNDPSDPLYQKLDMTKVGCSGHSMGGLESEQMLVKDKRVVTAVLNNSGAFNHAELANVPQGKTAAIVYGEGGMERPNAEGDYNNNNVRIPACLLKMTGGQGNECQQGECGWGHGSGPWGGMAATVAWMRWHLGGEDFRKDDFVGSNGKYINGAIVGQPGKWKGQCKNF